MLLLLNEKENNSNDRRKKVNFKKQGQANELGKRKLIEYIISRDGLWAKTNIKGIMAHRIHSGIEFS